MKRLLLLAFFLSASLSAMAQDPVDYRAQYAKLYKDYSRNPDDIATLVALADHFAKPDNPQHDLAQAGLYIHRAEALFEHRLQDNKEYRSLLKLIRRDISLITIRQRCRSIDSSAFEYLKANARNLEESELASYAEAFASNKAIHSRVNRLWIEKAYTRASKENTINAYYAFIQDHPDAPQADSAENRIASLAYDYYAPLSNEADILLAAQHYPKSRAMQHAAMLQCSRIAFAEASQLNTVGAYSAYIERFPQGTNYLQTLSRIEELNTAEFGTLVTPQDFADYALLHSDQPLADSAIARLRLMILSEHSTPAARLYLDNFPLDPAYSDIYREYYHWHSAEGNAAPLLRFADENPQYPYRLTLESDLARARGIDTIDLLRRFSEKDLNAMTTNIYKLTGRRIAFVALQRILQQQIARKDWKGAKTRWEHFSICFEETSTNEYNTLGNLLSATNAKGRDMKLSAGRYGSPCLSPDGQHLYLVYPRDGKHAILYLRPSTNKKEPWKYGGDVTVKGLTGDLTACALSANGRNAFLTIDGDIWTARLENETVWVVEERLPYPVNTDAVETDAYPLPDGSLLLASDRRDGHNLQPSHTYFHGDTALATDLYYIPRTPAGWGKPVNLGINVNTPYCERSPLLSRNMRTLYFISDGHAGLGYGDIFQVSRSNTDDWSHWSAPVNLGKDINTPFAEQSIAFAENEQRLYICSDAPEGNATSVCSSAPIQHDTASNFLSLRIELNNNSANVQNIEVIDLTRQSVTQAASPSLLLDRNHRYAILPLSSNLFFPAVTLPSPFPRSISPKGYTPQQAINRTFPLGTAIPNPNTRKLYPVSDHELQQLALFLLNNPSLYAQIEVHIQGPDDQHCYDLSVDIATAVRTRLAELGVSTSRIRLSGYGNVMFKSGKQPAPVSVRFLDKI